MSTKYLDRHTSKCGGCPLFKDRNHKCTHVPTELVINKKDEPIDVFFVGEAPSEDDDLNTKPLVGRAGGLFRKVLSLAIKDKKVNYAIGHIVRCRPTYQGESKRENRQPTPDERSHCKTYLLKELNKLKPKLVVGLGGIAAGGFLDKFPSIQAIHGVPLDLKNDLEGFDIKLLATYHPSAVLGNPYLLQYFSEDIKRAVGTSDIDEWNGRGKVKTLDTLSLVKKFKRYLFTKLDHHDVVAVDVETTNGVDRLNNSIKSIAFAFNGKKGFVIPCDHPDAPWKGKEFKKVKKILREIFTEEVPFKFWLAHEAAFELQQIANWLGVWIRNVPVIDSKYLCYLYDENRLTLKKELQSIGIYTLKQLAWELLGFPFYKEYLKGVSRKQKGAAIASMDYRTLLDYNAMDAYVTYRLYKFIKEKSGDYWPKLIKNAEKIGSRATYMFARAEINGFQVDVSQLVKLKSKNSPIDKAMEDIEEWFKKFKPAKRVNDRMTNIQSGDMNPLFGTPWVFDLNSKDCKVELFVNELQLEPLSYGAAKKNDPKQKPIPSIDKEFIAHYLPKMPETVKTEEDINKWLKTCTPAEQAVFKYAEYTGLYKLKTSYIESINYFINNSPECTDGRVRASFGITDTVTGRATSHDPNLQQVPKGDNKYKKAIKNLYSVRPGHVLISADYTQGEVYLLAQVAHDEAFAKLLWHMREVRLEYYSKQTDELAKRVKEECDIHRQTASMMFNLTIQNVQKKDRSSAKGIVFGLIYGKHVKSLARDLNIEVEEAEKLVRKFFSKFPASEKWLLAIEKKTAELHYVESLLHRRRHLPWLMSSDDGERQRCLRQARNSPIQSLLSDICLYSAASLQELIDEFDLDWKIVDVVHDAIIVEVPFNEVEQYLVLSEMIMTDLSQLEKDFGLKFIVPMAVEYEIGTHYGDLEEWGTQNNDIPYILNRIKDKWKALGYRIPSKKRKQVKYFDEDGNTTKEYKKFIKRKAA